MGDIFSETRFVKHGYEAVHMNKWWLVKHVQDLKSKPNTAKIPQRIENS